MPYKRSNEYMSWAECRALCPKGAIKRTDNHHWIDQKLCDQCRGLSEYHCGGIFENNSANYLQDLNTYWADWFTTYNQLLQRLQVKGGCTE